MPVPTGAAETRFWAKVDKSVHPNGCWEWTASLESSGYGQFNLSAGSNRRPHGAHRISYELAHGAILGDLCVLHRCDNRRCVNPGHLFLGTRADNIHDMDAKGRARKRKHPAACPYGHAYTPENTHWIKCRSSYSGKAISCRTCERLDYTTRRNGRYVPRRLRGDTTVPDSLLGSRIAQHPNKTLPAAVRRRVLARSGGRCMQCGSTERVEVDHIVPVVHGGANDESNYQALCRRCNRAKGPRAHERRRMVARG